MLITKIWVVGPAHQPKGRKMPLDEIRASVLGKVGLIGTCFSLLIKGYQLIHLFNANGPINNFP